MDPSAELKLRINFTSLGADTSLVALLELEPPPFRTIKSAFSQVKYLEDYIRRADLTTTSTERSIAIESHYIDRDFIVDHSVLFSRNLESPPNYCQRVHFFAAPAEAVKQGLRRIVSILSQGSTSSEKEYESACRAFSQSFYLGFAVIRPLPACPVGRTVLHVLPDRKNEDDSIRVMTCTRNYELHFMGVDLTIRGLAFQQQDLGVSRCATVAVWCALQKIREREGIASATPADITNLASKHRLPYGRSMPSEGLAIDQMCLAIESVGVSPYLARVETLVHGRSLVYAATLSEMPSILIMQMGNDQSVWHAVAVTGMKLNATHEPCIVGSAKAAGDDLSGDVKAFYVHDDRIGPYRRADLDRSISDELCVNIRIESHVPDGELEAWIVRHILIPMHPKIRVSFNDLRIITQKWLMPKVQSAVAGETNVEFDALPAVRFKYWIDRGHEYVQRVFKEQLLDEMQAIQFCESIVVPRYIGVIRFSSDRFGKIDVLMDTTSPRPNYNWIGIVARKSDDEQGHLRHIVAEYISDLCNCYDRYFR